MNNSIISRQLGNEVAPCIWMQAGVVPLKTCKENYNCTECGFNAEMNRIAEENRRLKEAGKTGQGSRWKIVPWKEALRRFPVSKRPCIHYMKNRIGYRLCTNNYRCGDCEFDQYFEDQYTVHTVVKPVLELEVESIKIPQGYYFHRGHTWMKVEEGNSALVGIDDFALRVLGPGDSIVAPLLGKEVKQESRAVSLKRGKKIADFLSPVTGVVTAVNQNVRKHADLASREPYSDGWVIRVEASDLRKDLKNLMIHRETNKFMKSEVRLLYKMIEDLNGPLAADGGMLAEDIFGNLPGLSWEKLTGTFLHT